MSIPVFSTINEDNFELIAARHYINAQCLVLEEFYSDLNNIKSIKKLIKRYKRDKDDLNLKLLINHTIKFFNNFDIDGGRKLLLYKFDNELDKDCLPALFTILLFLGIMSEKDADKYKPDLHIASLLRELIT
jgi:hypothetical protein